MKGKLPAHLALFGANLIYGLNYTIAKNVMPEYIKPFGFIFLRVTGALLLFWLFHALFFKEKVARKDFLRLAACGLFGVAINQLLFFKGLDITTPINAAIIMTTNPILVMVLAAIIMKEGMTWLRGGGILLGLSGAVTLFLFKDNFSIGSGTMWGDLLVQINAASYALYLIIVKPLMAKYQPMTVIKWVFLFGYLVVFPVGFSEFREIDWQNMPFSIYMETLYVVIGTTFLAYLFNIFALKELSPTIASAYIYLQPVLAGAFAIMMGKDELNFIKVVATIMIFSGVYLVSLPQKRLRKVTHS